MYYYIMLIPQHGQINVNDQHSKHSSYSSGFSYLKQLSKIADDINVIVQNWMLGCNVQNCMPGFNFRVMFPLAGKANQKARRWQEVPCSQCMIIPTNKAE
jgi:hypothetical protein